MESSHVAQVQKFSGAGNTFLIFFDGHGMNEARDQMGVSRGEMFRWVCGPMGLSADGGFLLTRNSEGEWSWDFYNSDGSPAEMCGNAARCAIAAIKERSPKENKINLITVAGPIRAIARPDGLYSIDMMTPDWFRNDFLVEGTYFDWLDTGVPHAVFEGESFSREKSRGLRAHPSFGPRGANITNFIEKGPREIFACSYERGVEDFTLACGTGAVAAALSFARRKQITSGKIEVEMPGGKIEVEMGKDHPVMTGEAIKIAEARIYWESLKAISNVNK